MDLVGNTNWARFKTLIQEDAHDTFFQDTITWKRYIEGIDEFMENDVENFNNVDLKCLINYNDFKVWPVNYTTETGELDRQNTVLLFSLKYLNGLGYLNANGNFIYNQSADRFLVNGQIYKATGDTLVSQAKDEPLLLQINLSKEEIPTGSNGN